MTLPARIRAVFSDGVFRPLARVDLPDNAEVELTIIDAGQFESWWEAHATRMRSRTASIPPADIERDVSEASREARAQRRSGA
jgi:predicted DNA-binding antitoxin AbrB/MazE fold protein